MISGILLAAGNSVRMGDKNKLLLPVDGRPQFQRMIEAMENSSLDEIIVVLGHDYKKMMELCASSKLKLAINGNHLEGQTSSIKAGMQLLNPSSTAVMICLCDMPLITSEHIDELISNYTPETILRPRSGKKPGNPSIFPKSVYDEIMACADRNGCKSVIDLNSEILKQLNTDDEAFFLDIDTPEEYRNFDP